MGLPAGAAKVRQVFAAAAAKRRAALITYHTFGYPDPETSVACMLAAVRGGADIIELGVPFSDPSADGPVIAGAMERALACGASLDGALDAARRIHAASPATGIVLFGYYNPIWVSVPTRFAASCRQAQVDAVLVVDLPLEELDELASPLAAHDVGSVPLLAPTSDLERASRLADRGAAFTYYISMAGVTGAAAKPVEAARVAQLRHTTRGPIAVGFGIKSPADVARTAAFADGVVIGSRLVAEIGDGAAERAPARVEALVRHWVEATQRG